MRYERADRDHALNKKAFKAALEAAEQDIQEEEDFAQIRAEEKGIYTISKAKLK